MASLALIYDEIYLKHQTGGHPENERRVRLAYEYLKSKPVFQRLTAIRPRPATDREILSVHSQQYLDRLLSLPATQPGFLDPDTLFGPGSLDAARSAAGAVTTAVEGIDSGDFDSVFCLVRPPGHHALPDRAMGFCIFNNIAIGAAYATRIRGFDRAAIIDFDVHHGNGTQDIFYDDADVLYCSLHEWPFYPGTGSRDQAGEGRGLGKTINVPLPHGSGEEAYLEALDETILPAVREHRPALIFISAGFDAHRADPIGGMALTEDSFGRLTHAIRDISLETCEGRIISALEGGYNVDALGASIHAHIEALLD
jgi:acetoin utilization deacetylase AcuC-like enzyme